MGPETRQEQWHRRRESRWKIRDQDCKEGQRVCSGRDRAFVALFVKAPRAAPEQNEANSLCRALGTQQEVMVEEGYEAN